MFGMGQVAACGADEDEICYMEDEDGRRIGRQSRELAGPVVRLSLRSLTDCQAISYTACGSTPQASYNTRARARRSAQRKTREPDDTFPLIPHTAGTVPLCHMY